MKKEVKYIWVVETANTFEFADGQVKTNTIGQSYFSTKEKALVHVEWVKSCADNNGATKVLDCENFIKYRLTNGENWSIRTTRSVIDADDLLMCDV